MAIFKITTNQKMILNDDQKEIPLLINVSYRIGKHILGFFSQKLINVPRAYKTLSKIDKCTSSLLDTREYITVQIDGP